MISETYGFLNIYYGTTSGNSKKMATDFKQQATNKGFLPILCNLGDYSPQRFLCQRLTILFLSTYGTGGPTEDAEPFLNWLISLSKEGKPLQQMGFVIFGLGNSTFQFFCGMSRKTRTLLLDLGARQVIPTFYSDAKNEDPYDSYVRWKKDILSQLIQNLNLQKIQMNIDEIKSMTKKFDIKISPCEIQKWDEEEYEHLNLNFEIKKYLKAEKAQVLQIKEIRRSSEGRSTLYIRIKTNSQNLSPACNVEIYPQNVIDESLYKGNVQFQSNHMVPFPPLPIKKLMKIMNSSAKPSKSFIQEALYMCKNPESAHMYQALLDQPDLWQNTDITSEDIIKQLDLGLEHQAFLGINLPRVYTLAGWKHGQIQLIVSLFIFKNKMGLTSKFLQSRPKQLKIRVLSSSFFIPQNPQTPLVMIANGSGIAPFRSILQYYMNQDSATHIRPIYLYYGCQKLQQDYYFREEWEQAEKKGMINLNIATSRQGEKQYVQHLLKKDMQKFKKLIFEDKAIFFVCGSLNMDRDLNNLFIAAFKQNGFKPYTALTKVKELQRQKRVVKEVYG